MTDIFKIAFSTVFFWLVTFGIVFAHEHYQASSLGTKLVNAVMLSSLLTVPVFLFVCHTVLVICPECKN